MEQDEAQPSKCGVDMGFGYLCGFTSSYWCRKTFEAIGAYFGGLEAILVETFNHTIVAEAKFQVKQNLCCFMQATIKIADENCQTFLLNYGDIEVFSPSSKVKGDFALKGFF